MTEAHSSHDSSDHHDDDYHKIDNHGGHEEEEGEGPWLMSFADMVTLLMCFFILFFSVDKGNVEVDDPRRLKEILEKSESKSKITEKLILPKGQELQKPQSEEAEAGATKSSEAADSGPEAPEAKSENTEQKFEKIFHELRETFKESDLAMTIHQVQPGLIEIVMLNVQFFRTGDSAPTAAGAKAIAAIADKLKSLPPASTIEVEGHTDSDPVSGGKFPSNWELSTARSSAVVRQLADAGVDTKIMRATGLASNLPVAPEYDDRGFPLIANKALNRRIIIRLRAPNQPGVGGQKSEPAPQDSVPDTSPVGEKVP